MSSSTTPPDPYGAGDGPDRSSGSTPPPPPPPYGGDRSSGPGSTPPPSGSTPPPYGSIPDAGSTPPPYGSPPPPYGSATPSYGDTSSYGGQPPTYGGAAYGDAQPYGYGFPKNGLGVWSLVLGLVGVFVCGLFAGIPAIVVGHKARRAVADGQANNPGMATAGIVLGWIATILSLVALAGLVLLIATGTMTEFENMDTSGF